VTDASGLIVKTALVTGVSGFIGSSLCSYLLRQGWFVRGLSRSGSSPDGVNAVACDLADTPVPEEMIRGVDVVFHLAGKAHALSGNWLDEEEYFPVNVKATRRLLDAAKTAGVKRVVYFSSIKAMSAAGSGPQDESCGALPKDMYGRSKLMAEHLLLHGGFVPEPVVIRPVMVYGNTEKGNLPKMIRAIRNGRFPPLPDTRNQRSMIHVDDIAHAALLAADHPAAAGNVYIVTDGQVYSTRQIYVWICEALQKSMPGWRLPFPVLKVLGKGGDVIGRIRGRKFMFDSDVLEKLTGSEFYSSEKIQNELGFKAQYHLKETLPEIIHYLE